jgi:DNA-binding transcriptional ArsR family regulator
MIFVTWRIHFTEADLDRIQIRDSPGPLTETVFAFSFLRCPLQPQGLFSGWRTVAIGHLTSEMTPLAAMVPVGSRGPDFYTLTGEAPTIEQGIMALLAVPSEDMIAEFEAFARYRRLPKRAWAVATDEAARRDLADAIRAAYRLLVEPYWPRISAQLHAAQVARHRLLRDGGPERLLASLRCRTIQWRSPVLELQGTSDVDLHLNGTGIALVPSLFAGRIPALHLDGRYPDAPPRLVLPSLDLAAGNQPGGDPRGGGEALGALLGKTRAAALAAVALGCTTTELAQRCEVSLAAASQHATVLRNAGLITTSRQGSAVLHVLTPLGAGLLGDLAAGQSWLNAFSSTSRPSFSNSGLITNGGRKRSTLP